MTQNEKEALAKFVISTNEGIKGLMSLMNTIAAQIDGLKERVSALERKGGNEEDNNSCEPTQD